MRYYEFIVEALTPEERVVFYQNTDNPEQNAVVIGGRVLNNVNLHDRHTLRNINLKNVRSPNGPLLFHGSIDGSINRFHDNSWFSAEPFTAFTHATFWQGVTGGRESFIYVCSAKIRNPIMNPDAVPGEEGQHEISNLYKNNPGSDAIIWENTKDVIMPKTDLYNIRSGGQIQILKKWEIVEKDVSQDEWDHIFKGKALPKKEVDPDKIYKVVEPGLSYFEMDQPISQAEYDEFKQYGVKVSPLG